jgi:tight adherence protein C
VSGTLLIAIAAGAFGLAIAMMVMALGSAQAKEGGVAGALAAIEQTYTKRVEATGHDRASDLFAQLPGWLRVLALRLSPSSFAVSVQRRLDLAGNPPRWSIDRILAAKGLGLLGLGSLGVLIGLHNFALLLILGAAMAAFGFFLPDIWLYNLGQKRQAQIRIALPDALDMLTICVEAGLGFDAALAQVARNSDGPLAAEFARVLQEMQIGKSRSQALRAIVGRTTVTELRSFVSALVQAGELGIAVARVLREQAKEMRLRRRQRAEEQAQKVPVKILFPLIVCLFPALMVIIIGPGGITIASALFGH